MRVERFRQRREIGAEFFRDFVFAEPLRQRRQQFPALFEQKATPFNVDFKFDRKVRGRRDFRRVRRFFRRDSNRQRSRRDALFVLGREHFRRIRQLVVPVGFKRFLRKNFDAQFVFRNERGGGFEPEVIFERFAGLALASAVDRRVSRLKVRVGAVLKIDRGAGRRPIDRPVESRRQPERDDMRNASFPRKRQNMFPRLRFELGDVAPSGGLGVPTSGRFGERVRLQRFAVEVKRYRTAFLRGEERRQFVNAVFGERYLVFGAVRILPVVPENRLRPVSMIRAQISFVEPNGAERKIVRSARVPAVVAANRRETTARDAQQRRERPTPTAARRAQPFFHRLTP